MVDLAHNPWRGDFPALKQTMHGKRLAFLDSGASAQKPQMVVDAVMNAYTDGYANIHRGLYDFSQRKTAEFEAVRTKVAEFIGAESEHNIVFTRNTTEAINLVAQSWGRAFFKAGDEVILTQMEHHANIVPWHLLAETCGIVVKYVPITPEGGLDYAAFEELFSPRTRLVALTHVSNVLGTVNDLPRIRALIDTQKNLHGQDIVFLVDGSQGAVHKAVHLPDFAPDFYVLTGHKLYGPTGVGVLYGRAERFRAMPPWQGGGDMIATVTFAGSTYAEPPARFEAGTPAIAEVIGLGAAIDYVRTAGMDAIAAWEKELSSYMHDKLQAIAGLRVFGTCSGKAGIASFELEGCPPSDVAMILDQSGVAVRTGHHCCQPLMQILGVSGTIRASLGLYSDKQDIDQLCDGLHKAIRMLR